MLSTALDLLRWPFPVRPEDVAACCVHYGQPVPWERVLRALAGRRARAVKPRRTRGYQRSLALLLRAETELKPPDKVSLFGVRLWFFRRGRGKCDLDNLAKSVLDACKPGHVFADDAQVRELHARLSLGCENPRVEIVIYRLRNEG